eukprot:TRINITY_DN96791_c0_g1_i1.p1 TRINITY_DN96791_c0_g1~~TRINITY_DN96791_c0_g1_i1.p1  ORF type:complete len:211 (-),score=26.96 TRINITY_DN96791_c0_g1_i1:74-706(-)
MGLHIKSMDNTFHGMKAHELEATAGADLRHHLGRKSMSMRDPRYASAPSFSFGCRSDHELNSLSSNSTFLCKSGTHRACNGQLLLDHLRRRDDKTQKALLAKGRQYKATPGPGAYRIPRLMGDVDRTREISVNKISAVSNPPTWKVGSSLRPRMYHTIGGVGHGLHNHEGKLRPPTPRNLTPGPGHYFKESDSCPSNFSDFMRPQNRQVV